MEIKQEENGQLAARLKVFIEEEDYKDTVDEKLKEYRKSASMPGFRPGKVPAGMIKRMYGKSLLIDEVNEMLSKKLTEYLREKELNILGYPIAVTEGAPEQDWELQKEFEFWFDIGLAPEVNASIEDLEGIKLYSIEVEDDKVDSYIKDLQRKLGEHVQAEETAPGDILRGMFTELNEEGEPREEGIRNESSLSLDFIKDEDIKEELTGMKVGDSFVFNPMKATGHAGEVASMLDIPKKIAENLESEFRFTLTEITRLKPAEVNEEFFSKVFPDAEGIDENQFRERIREEIGKSLQREAEIHFFNEAVKHLMDKEEMPLPEDFLKRWLLSNSKKEITEEELEEQFPAFLRSMRWQILQDTLLDKNDINVSEKDIRKHIQSYFQQQFSLPGDESEEELDPRLAPIIDNVMENKEEVQKIQDQLVDEKMVKLFLEKVPHESEDIKYDDFLKLVAESRKD